jgi:hypothetical protein
VSYGLAADLRRSGNKLNIDVHGPSWAAADRLIVYANGVAIADRPIPESSVPGLKRTEQIVIDKPAHDLTLVAVVTGPGVRLPFWEVRKPYQPVSKDWTPRLIGVSKAVRIDADGNGFQSPWDYAGTLLRQYPAPSPELITALGAYGQSVAIQVLSRLAQAGAAPETLRELFAHADAETKKAFDMFIAEWSAAGSRR